MARERQEAEHERTPLRSLLDTLGVIVGAVVLAVVVQAFIVKPYKIPSPSMVPTLEIGQRVLVNRVGNMFGDPNPGDVVVLTPPSGAGAGSAEETCGRPRAAGTACTVPREGHIDETFIKRIAGGPGDRLSLRSGRLIRNGKAVDEPYAQSCDGEACNIAEFTVPAGHYFMLGDNRGNSDDSRFWGPVERDYIIGKAFATYWPPSRIGGL